MGLEPVDIRDTSPTPAAIAVALDPIDPDHARHVHRAAWTAGGGPWLGIGDAGELEVVTTCHLAIDGYGHGLVCREVFSRERERERERAEPVHRRELSPSCGEPTGFAFARVDPAPRFPRAAYAFARALAHTHGRDVNFQVPVALRGDRAGRVVHGVFAAPEGEAFEHFERRLVDFVERERAGRGALTRLGRVAAALPLPRSRLRKIFAGTARSRRWMPPVEAFSARGRLSSLRFTPGEEPAQPLVACSVPSLQATAADPRGAAVLTLVHDRDGATATVSGTGAAGTHAGASELLELWESELATRDAARRPDPSPPLARPGTARR